jgi:hypothetical protein
MNHKTPQIAGWGFAFGIALDVAAAVAQEPTPVRENSELVSYPWSDTSELARVSKRFLERIWISPVTVTNYENFRFVITDKFIRAFGLTPKEVARATTAIADAMHEYRKAEGRHLASTVEEPNTRRAPWDEPGAIEKFNFQLTPFAAAAAAIRRKLEEDLLAALGPRRSKCFWENGTILNSEMKLFDRELPVPEGMTRSTIFTYLFKEAKPGYRIEVFRSDSTRRIDRGPGGGVGMVGRPSGETLDQYAPEKMKPILARWRTTMAETAAKNAAQPAQASLPAAEAKEPGATATSQATGAPLAARWDESSPYVDLPKSLIESLKVPGLDLDGEIAPEAAALFGLTPSEDKAVRALSATMKARFEKLERRHFGPIGPGKKSFVLRPFPEESQALQREWKNQLQGLIGTNRAGLLDESIRTPIDTMQLMRSRRPAESPIHLHERAQSWLQRGTDEVQLDVSPGPARRGQPTLRIEIRGQGGRPMPPWFGPQDQIPERWRYLLTPDVQGTPLAFSINRQPAPRA